MDGEFIVQELVGVGQGVGGGNVIIQAVDQQTGLQAARRAVQAVAQQTGVVTPFPAGVARSGSKVGSRYPGLVASTAEAFCPTLRGRVDSRLDPAAQSAYEVVIDGVGQREVAAAMAAAMHAAAGEGVVCLSAGNYGGQLGKYHFSLHQLLAD